MNVLAIDTATSHLRLAVRFSDDRTVRTTIPSETTHARILMREIENIMVSADVGKSALNGIVINTGPGSFTGLRIGLAAVKGMALALDIPIVDVSMFDLAKHQLGSLDRPYAVLAPLKRDAFVCAVIDSAEKQNLTVIGNEPAALSDLQKRFALAVIGIDLERVSLPPEVQTDVRVIEYDAADLLVIGTARLSRGESSNLESLEPVYSRLSEAELRFNKRR